MSMAIVAFQLWNVTTCLFRWKWVPSRRVKSLPRNKATIALAKLFAHFNTSSIVFYRLPMVAIGLVRKFTVVAHFW